MWSSCATLSSASSVLQMSLPRANPSRAWMELQHSMSLPGALAIASGASATSIFCSGLIVAYLATS